MRKPGNGLFNVGLAAGGCFGTVSGVAWIWPFGDPYALGGVPLIGGTFWCCYLLAWTVGRLVDGLESAAA
jgi:hypothetical protein